MTTVSRPSTIEPSGTILTPSDPGWDEARMAWNLAVDQRPAAVARVRSPEDVVAAIEFARERGQRVAAQGTGHNAGALGSLDDTVLVKTEAMRRVDVDAGARTARVEAGAVWLDVVEAAGAHGLAALAGSSPDVGVVGYTLGGGLSWLGRSYGLSASNVAAIEVVTADGRIRRVDNKHEPELFWALRGGGGSFGVVTAIELRLFPVTEVYAGVLWWPIERGREVLQRWLELTQSGLPEALTTVGRYLQLPPLPEIPEPVRGKSFVVVEVIHLGPPAEADELLSPLRALEPVMDTVETIPVQALTRLHMDPEHPVPGKGDGVLLGELSAEAIDELVRVAGVDAGSPLLSVEVRHLGGRLARSEPGDGALASIEADYAMFAVGIVPTPEAAAAVGAHLEAVKATMAPWTARHMYLNLAETRRDPSTFWSDDAYGRLRRIKAEVDPTDLIRSNHPISPHS
ncbi:MAG TPA: FAD-binding oxidoreductase [Acidimicrobiales bacterium]|nr:FAD-binding oxidoreductase [Acidimicrobiales bacterium]